MRSPLIHPFCAPRRDNFINLVGGKGAVVWDANGKEYVDGIASLWYQNIGYGREEMVEAIARQASKLSATNIFDDLTTEAAEAAAAKIAGMSPMGPSRVFFGSSGSEAVDSSMKIARIAQREAGNPQKHIIVSRERGYHGTNYGGTSVQGLPLNREGYGPYVGGVICVPADNPEAMAAVFDEHGDEIAAVISEPVQGAGGVWPAPPGYLEGVRRLCDAHGAYLIFDEVITGFGRTGRWFGAEYYGVIPDLITFAKAVTSGYVPFSGVIVGPKVTAALEANEGFVFRHGYTYSGHPLGAAAALTSIGIQEREGLPERATLIGEQLQAGLESMKADGLVSDVRGVGAVWGVSVPEGVDAPSIRVKCLEKGVIVRPLGEQLALCPPLVITGDQIDQILDAMAEALG